MEKPERSPARPAAVDPVTSPAENLAKAHLRIARPSDDLAPLVRFYRDGLGFELLYEFHDHDGFEGVMLGHPGTAYHLEFTRSSHYRAGRAPTEDNLLVFYLPDPTAWRAAVHRLELAGYSSVKALNPYWDRFGRTFEDPDGYRVVIQNASWPVPETDANTANPMAIPPAAPHS